MTHPFDVANARAKAFRASLPDRPPRPVVVAAEFQARFDGPTPEHGEDSAAVIEALANAAEPGLMAVPGPRFFGWVMGASHEVGVAADWLASAWGQNAGLYVSSPAAAMAEKISAQWLLDILNLPDECSIGFVTGATMANFVCLAAARSAVLARFGWDVEDQGLRGAPEVRVMLGEDAHTSVFAALRFLGFGAAGVQRIPTDRQGRMLVDALEQALAAGAAPAIVIAQAGQINTGAFDPFDRIARLCRARGAWLHVDAAFGLWARAVPEMAARVEGLDQADSWAADGHKWLQVPYDTGFAIVRDPNAHRRAMTIGASYLSKTAGEYEPSHYAPELSRRARGFAVWAMIRALGRNGIMEMVRAHCEFAKRLAERLSSEAGITVLNEVSLNQVVVAFGEDDETTRAVISRLQHDNVCFADGARWRGRWVMRLSFIAAPLTAAAIDHLGDAIVSAWRHVQLHAAESKPFQANHLEFTRS